MSLSIATAPLIDPPCTASASPTGVRYLDVVDGALIDVFDRNGRTEISFVGQNGWDPVSAPTRERFLKTRLYQTLGATPWGALLRASFETVHQSVRRIRKASTTTDGYREDMDRMFAQAAVGPASKSMLAIDIVEECHAAEVYRGLLDRYRYDGRPPIVYGEESLFDPSLDLSKEARPVVLLDTVDGTDEVEQGLTGWCSSAIVYDPRTDRILGAFVGMADGTIYFALTASADRFVGKCRLAGDDLAIAPNVHDLAGPSGVAALSDSVVAFYGHKPSRLQSLADHPHYRALLARMSGSPRARIRTQGGQPMMMRLVDRCGYRRVDAVFELIGQAPHDVVAGLHIARLAGATLCGLDGQPLDLSAAICRPAARASRLTYVLAASRRLAFELLERDKAGNPIVQTAY